MKHSQYYPYPMMSSGRVAVILAMMMIFGKFIKPVKTEEYFPWLGVSDPLVRRTANNPHSTYRHQPNYRLRLFQVLFPEKGDNEQSWDFWQMSEEKIQTLTRKGFFHQQVILLKTYLSRDLQFLA